MKTTRRQVLTGGALAALGGGFLARLDKVAGQQSSSSPSLTDTLKQQASDASLSKLIKPKAGAEGPPQPAYFDRLPLEWNKRTVKRFKKKLAEQDLHAFLVRDRLNIIYLTGYWHTTTERPQSVFMNKDDADPWYFYPSLDRDLVRTWWFGDGRTYFDFQHGRGAFPHESRVQQGEKVDLFEFMLEGVKQHGIQGNKVGIDGELCPSELEKAAKVLPGVGFVDVSDVLMGMRQVKTPEELALWRRAYVYFDRAHAFARDYILTHGTDVTDYEVKHATELWINDQLYSDIDLADGAAHHGVFTGVHLGVRSGPVTAYPHPNQPSYNRIEKGAALQIAGIARVGGYGHELYRPFIIAGGGGQFDSHMQHLWEVSKACCDMQLEMSAAGVTCSSIAYAIHKYQVEQNVQRFVYHRPAHGAGVEGHQSPYIALGDYTMLERNMCFSEEPGLYDPEHKCGFNWSDTIVVGTKSGYRMSFVPYTKDWCWITL